jgi:hypothetical protein
MKKAWMPITPDLVGEREDVGVAHSLGIDRLAALDEGECLQPVAQHRRQLEIEILGRGLHLLAELGLDLVDLPWRKSRASLISSA